MQLPLRASEGSEYHERRPSREISSRRGSAESAMLHLQDRVWGKESIDRPSSINLEICWSSIFHYRDETSARNDEPRTN